MRKKVRRTTSRRERGGGELITLSELAKRAGVSLATAHRYRREFGDRLPSRGEGRRRRYLPAAIEVLKTLVEGKGKGRGRARKTSRAVSGPRAARPARAVRAAKAIRSEPPRRGRAQATLLSLRKISQMTGISYPTLMRYVARHGQGIPQQGSGRKRRFPPEAVAVFQELRAHRGRLPRGEEVAARGRKGGDSQLLRRLQSLEEAHAELTRKLRRLQRMLDRPWRVTLSRSR